MKYLFQVRFKLLILLVLASCVPKKKPLSEGQKSSHIIQSDDSSWTYLEYRKGVDVAFTNCNNRNFIIKIQRNNESLQLNLNELNIPWKTPEITWANQELMCITTWWSGPFAKYIFIPLKGKLNTFIFLDHSLDFVDSTTNIVAYTDPITGNNSIQLTVEQLVSRKRLMFQFPVDSSGYNAENQVIKYKDGKLNVRIENIHKRFDISSLVSTNKL
jgi:hypothetical protein